MKTLILIATFLVSFGFTTAVMPSEVADVPTAADVKKELCNIIANNGVATMNNINAGISKEDTIAQINEVFGSPSEANSFAAYTQNMSVSVADALYNGGIVAQTEDELGALGRSIFAACYKNTVVRPKSE